jgi:hypothetical protein
VREVASEGWQREQARRLLGMPTGGQAPGAARPPTADGGEQEQHTDSPGAAA